MSGPPHPYGGQQYPGYAPPAQHYPGYAQAAPGQPPLPQGGGPQAPPDPSVMVWNGTVYGSQPAHPPSQAAAPSPYAAYYGQQQQQPEQQLPPGQYGYPPQGYQHQYPGQYPGQPGGQYGAAPAAPAPGAYLQYPAPGAPAPQGGYPQQHGGHGVQPPQQQYGGYYQQQYGQAPGGAAGAPPPVASGWPAPGHPHPSHPAPAPGQQQHPGYPGHPGQPGHPPYPHYQGYAHAAPHQPASAPASTAAHAPPLPDAAPSERPRSPVNVMDAESLFDAEGRRKRPSHIVMVLRGLPGSGKTHVAKVIRDFELKAGDPAPRTHSIDDYFMVEVDDDGDTAGGKRKSGGGGGAGGCGGGDYAHGDAQEAHVRGCTGGPQEHARPGLRSGQDGARAAHPQAPLEGPARGGGTSPLLWRPRRAGGGGGRAARRRERVRPYPQAGEDPGPRGGRRGLDPGPSAGDTTSRWRRERQPVDRPQRPGQLDAGGALLPGRGLRQRGAGPPPQVRRRGDPRRPLPRGAQNDEGRQCHAAPDAAHRCATEGWPLQARPSGGGRAGRQRGRGERVRDLAGVPHTVSRGG
mmetsp:Transcript_34917/g.110296  ORF Transcript_34917/g.110296 Transcript_34917/m.110296 type:complete len:574 (-) Transcript_34917:521-2242(-)